MSFEIASATKRFDTKNFSKVALIDADRYKHLACYRMFQEIDSGKEHSHDLLEEIIDEYLYNDIFSHFKAKAFVFCFSAPSKDVFRNWISQEKLYKGNRKGKADLYDYDQKWDDMAYVFRYIQNNYTTLAFSDLEADDLLSMLQHPTDTFIFSHDKDLKQVIGFHYDMTRRLLVYTDEKEGFERLIDQVLLGDTTDNIPGLKGFGPKALDKFKEELYAEDQFEYLIQAIQRFIDKYGLLQGMDAFAEMWHLVSMRLDRGDYNREKYHRAFELINSLVNDGKSTAVSSV
jgi:hypothetical protein